MKITRKILENLIKEQLDNILQEQTPGMSLPPVDQLSANPTRAILARDLNVALQQLDQKLDQILARLDQDKK